MTWRLARYARLAAALLLVVLGCDAGAELPKHVELVQPVYGAPCRYVSCGEHGECVADGSGEPSCECQVGYAGVQCERCGAGFHLDARERCVPDRSCALQDPNPCSPYGSCDDSQGVIACHCDPGYEGPRCTLCERGYARDSFGDCLPVFLVDRDGSIGEPGPGEGPGGDSDGAVPQLPECHAGTCSGHGLCLEVSGVVTCECESGYAGTRCNRCAPGFEEQPDESCAPAAGCEDDTCPEHASCDESTGYAVCSCDLGYGGIDCVGCASGYYRSLSSGGCVPLECDLGTDGSPVRVSFDELADFPVGDDTCVSGAAVNRDDLAFESIDGDGVVWACSASSRYGLPSQHLFVEAGVLHPAKLTFARPISRLRFTYGARTALWLELKGDGVVLGSIAAVRRTSGTHELMLDPPISELALRSLDGFTNQVGLDDLEYTFATCE